jgi:hypothetical protein
MIGKERHGAVICPARDAARGMIPRTGCCRWDITARGIGKWMNVSPVRALTNTLKQIHIDLT